MKYEKEFRNKLVLRGLQPITINGYVKCMMRILNKIGTDNPTQEQLEEYVVNLYQSNYSYSHKTNTVLAIERYTEFLKAPLKFGRQKKPKHLIKNTLTEGEITQILFNCKNIREKAILSVLSYSGIRNLELCNIKTNDFDAAANTIRINQGKGLKERISYIAPQCSKIILEYLVEYPRHPEEYLFTTIKKNNKYHTGDLRKLLFVVTKRTKIQKRVYPHLMRHSLATNMLNRGANLLTIKNQLGHAFIDTTMTYINSMGYCIKNEYERFAPSYL